MRPLKEYVFRSKLVSRGVLRGVMAQIDIIGLQRLAPLPGSYVPWSSSSIRPSAVATVLNDILINGRVCIVECGSGVSTIYIARLLKRVGGRLYSIEHDERWFSFVKTILRDEDLIDNVSLVHAPLKWSVRFEHDWYAPAPLGDVLPSSGIDLLLIDGPPAHRAQSRGSRYPALPYFWNRLSADCTLIIADVDRRGEQEVVRRWETELPVRFQRRLIEGSIAVALRGEAFSP